jgi:hypothetical protein
MSDLPTTMTKGTTPMVIPRATRSLMHYVPEAHIVAPKGLRRSLSMLRHEGDLLALSLFSLAGGGVAGVSVMGLVAAVANGLNPESLTMLTAGVGFPTFMAAWSFCMRRGARDTDEITIDAIRDRVIRMTKTCSDPSRKDAMLTAMQIASDQIDKLDRPLLIRLDAVAISLEAALRAAGPDAEATANARDMAEQAIVSIMATVEAKASRIPSATASLALEELCRDMGVGMPASLQPPTARIERILAIARDALETHPDLVDGAGARIDDLIDVHVPRLLSVRAEAVRTASASDLDAVDETFAVAFDKIAASIREGMESIHDSAMDRLATEVRFLSARRNETALLPNAL